MKTKPRQKVTIPSNLRALSVEKISYVNRGGYSISKDTVYTQIGVFLVPEDFHQYQDSHGMSNDEWIKSMKKRFAFVPAVGDSATLYPS